MKLFPVKNTGLSNLKRKKSNSKYRAKKSLSFWEVIPESQASSKPAVIETNKRGYSRVRNRPGDQLV